MRIKIFQGMSETKVEASVNDFLSNSAIKVIEIKYKPTVFYFSVLIVYEDNSPGV